MNVQRCGSRKIGWVLRLKVVEVRGKKSLGEVRGERNTRERKVKEGKGTEGRARKVAGLIYMAADAVYE